MRAIEFKQANVISVPIKNLSLKECKPETLLYNIAKTLNTNDTSKIDFTYGGKNEHILEPLNNRFCDNIILYYNIPKANNKEEAKDYLAENTIKIKRVLNSLEIKINKHNIKPTRIEDYKTYTRQYIKVSLPDIPLDNAIKLVIDKEAISLLHKNELYVNDIDITQDFSGCINKENVIQYLIEEQGFVREGTYEHADKLIKDNDKKVGNNCLTFLTRREYGDIRYKFYNKFIQSLESPSVRGAIGSHISDWIHNPENILDESISNSLLTGLLRLEITFYIEQDKTPTKQYFNEHMDYLQQLLPKKLIYHNTIEQQWKLYLNAISYNCLIYDIEHNIALLAYSINSLTEKINGFYINDINNNKLNNIIKLFTYNVPLVVLSYTRNGDRLDIEQQCFRKKLLANITKKVVIDELLTYISYTTNKFHIASKSPNTPASRGLVDTSKCKLRYCAFKNISTLSTTNIPIAFEQVDNIIKLPTISLKDRNKEKEFLTNNKEIIDKVYSYNEEIIKEEEELRKTDQIITELEEEKKQKHDSINKHLIETIKDCSVYNKLLDLKDNVKLHIFAYKELSKVRTVIATYLTDTIDENTKLEIYLADKSLKDFLYNNSCYWDTIDNNINIYSNGMPLCSFVKNGTYYDKNRHIQPLINIDGILFNIENKYNVKDEEIDIKITEKFNKKMDLEKQVKSFEHKRVNSKVDKIDNIVKEGDVIIILDTFSWKNTNIITFYKENDTTPLYAKSNSWLDDIIKEHSSKFSCVVGPIKLHPIARRKSISFIMPNKIIDETNNKIIDETSKKITDETSNNIEEYNTNMDKYNKYQERIKIKSLLLKTFKDTNISKLIELEDKSHLFIYAVKFVKTSYGETVILATHRESSITSTSQLKLFWGTQYLYTHFNNYHNDYKEIGICVLGSATGNPITELEFNGTYINQSNKLCPKINIYKFNLNSEEESVYRGGLIKPKKPN